MEVLSYFFLGATLPWGSWPASEVPTLGERLHRAVVGDGQRAVVGSGSLGQTELRGTASGQGQRPAPLSPGGLCKVPLRWAPGSLSHTGLFIHWLLSPYFLSGTSG